jgi:hypothetical protein
MLAAIAAAMISRMIPKRAFRMRRNCSTTMG